MQNFDTNIGQRRKRVHMIMRATKLNDQNDVPSWCSRDLYNEASQPLQHYEEASHGFLLRLLSKPDSALDYRLNAQSFETLPISISS